MIQEMHLNITRYDNKKLISFLNTSSYDISDYRNKLIKYYVINYVYPPL